MSRRRRPWLTVALASLRTRRSAVWRLVVWSLIEAVPVFVSGRAVARAVDAFLAGQQTVAAASIAVFAVSVIIGAVATRRVYLGLAALVEPFRDELVERVVVGSLRRSTMPGEPPDTAAVSRLTDQVEVVRDTMAGLIAVTFSFALTLVSVLAGMFTLAPVLLLFVVPPLIVGAGASIGVLVLIAKRQRALLLAKERIAAATTRMAGGLRDIVACGGEERIRAEVGATIEAQKRASVQLARATAARSLTLAIAGWLPLPLLVSQAPWLLEHGATTGAIAGSVMYILSGLQPALSSVVHGFGGTIVRLSLNLGRIIEASDVPDPDGAGTGTPVPRRHGDLELWGVRFAYGPHAEPVIEDLDLFVPDGDRLVLVGPSGAGKSTLASIMAGVLQPQAGTVRIGGIPWDGPGLSTYRVYVPQEAYVFGGTLRENLTYLRGDVADQHLDEAVDAVGLRAVVDRIGGYDAQVSTSELSAGECQLVALTRAYLSPARLVILDEAMCYLDPAAEARAELAFTKRLGTVVIIAHRISSALRARRVLVMDGRSVMVGSHQTVLGASALYRELVGHWQSGEPGTTAAGPDDGQPAGIGNLRPYLAFDGGAQQRTE